MDRQGWAIPPRWGHMGLGGTLANAGHAWNGVGAGCQGAFLRPPLLLPLAEPCLERPSPSRPLQRQTTWAGRSLRDPASPVGRLVKSGSLGSARGAQPTVETGVAHSECPWLLLQTGWLSTCQEKGRDCRLGAVRAMKVGVCLLRKAAGGGTRHNLPDSLFLLSDRGLGGAGTPGLPRALA